MTALRSRSVIDGKRPTIWNHPWNPRGSASKSTVASARSQSAVVTCQPDTVPVRSWLKSLKPLSGHHSIARSAHATKTARKP